MKAWHGQAAEGETMRVLLADDHPKVRFALNALLKQRPEIVVLGEAKDADELMAKLADGQPELLLIDWQLPGLVEAGSIAALRQGHPDLMIVVLSSRPELGREALSLGADDFVSKIDPPESLLRAIAACIVRPETKHVEVNAS